MVVAETPSQARAGLAPGHRLSLGLSVLEAVCLVKACVVPATEYVISPHGPSPACRQAGAAHPRDVTWSLKRGPVAFDVALVSLKPSVLLVMLMDDSLGVVGYLRCLRTKLARLALQVCDVVALLSYRG